MFNEQDFNDFRQWMINKGKTRQELTDIYTNDNGEIKKEKKMAWVVKLTSPEDWKEFCKDTGREFEWAEVLAIY